MITVIVVLILATILQSSVTNLPLVLCVLLSGIVCLKNPWIFLFGVLAEIVIDISTIRPVGASSFFLLISLFTVFLYERKFEIRSFSFIVFITSLAVLIRTIIFKNGNIIMFTLTAVVFNILVYSLFNLLLRKKSQKEVSV